jgi:hypothetical protein
MIVELITKETLADLQRHTRRYRKERNERMLNTTFRDVMNMLDADISSFQACPTTSVGPHQLEPEGVIVPELPSGEVVGAYEDEDQVRLLLFARDVGTPLLVRSCSKPSKRGEETFRQSAKIRGCRLHYYRLIGYVAIEVEPRQRPVVTRTLGTNLRGVLLWQNT